MLPCLIGEASASTQRRWMKRTFLVAGVFSFLEDATMEELSKQLSERVGIDQSMADKISAVLQGNMGEMHCLLEGEGQGLVQLLQKVGIDEGIAQKVVTFLKENSGNLQAWLGQEGGILAKAKEMLGGILAGKGSS
jgi:hypothetical protein